MSLDPFKAQEPEPEDVNDVPASPVVSTAPTRPVSDEGKIVVTLKGGAGFEAPWIVVHAGTVGEANEILYSDEMVKLVERAQNAANAFRGKAPAATGSAAPAKSSGARPGQPQASTQPPPNAPDCPPGWTYKSGVTKAGKPYQGFFPPRGDDSKPIWFD